MRLQHRPSWQVTASVAFHDFPRAVAAARAIAQAGLYPVEPPPFLHPAEAFLNATTAVSGGLLVVAFESADHPVDTWLDRALEITAEHGGAVISRRGRDDSGTDAATNWRSAFLRMPYQRDALARRA